MSEYRTNMGALRDLRVDSIQLGSGEIPSVSLARALCQYPIGLLRDEQEVELTTGYRDGAVSLGNILHTSREDYLNVWIMPIEM